MDLFSNTSKGKYDLNVDYDDGLIKPFLWCALSAFILMMICSNKSFLYGFDQNGIISHLLWIEIIVAFFSLMAIMRIYQLFLEPRTFPYILMPITGALIYSGKNFNGGGNAEELMFPFVMWGIYLSLKYFRCRYPKTMSYWTVFIGGILAGCALFVKLSSLGFFGAWIAMVFFADLLGEKMVSKALLSGLVFIGGIGISTIPWLIYFAVRKTGGEGFYMHLYKNVLEYPGKLDFVMMKSHLLDNLPVVIIMAIGIVYFLASTISTAVYEDNNALVKRNRFFISVGLFEFINIVMLFTFLMLSIAMGDVNQLYCSFPVNGFVVFGFVPFCYIIEKFIKRRIERKTHGRNYDGAILDAGPAFAFSLISMIISAFVAYFTSH